MVVVVVVVCVLEEDAGVAVRVDVLRVESEGSPVLGLGPHHATLVLEEDAEVEVRLTCFGSRASRPVLGLSHHRVALGLEEDAELARLTCLLLVDVLRVEPIECVGRPVFSLGPHHVARRPCY